MTSHSDPTYFHVNPGDFYMQHRQPMVYLKKKNFYYIKKTELTC